MIVLACVCCGYASVAADGNFKARRQRQGTSGSDSDGQTSTTGGQQSAVVFSFSESHWPRHSVINITTIRTRCTPPDVLGPWLPFLLPLLLSLSLPFLHHAADKEAKVPCTSVLLSPVSVFQKLWSRRSSGVTRTVCRRSFNTFSALVHPPFSLSIPPVGKAAAVFYSIVLAALALLPSTLAPLPSLLPNSAGPLRQAPDLRLPDHT